MLNEKQERELCYVVKVEEIRPLEGYDRVEYGRIGAGWWCIIPKGAFSVGSLGIYFEVDSQVPQKEPFMFLDKRKFRIKTQKMCGVLSQGLLMSPADFGWKECDGVIATEKNEKFMEKSFLTKKLGVTYYDPEDVARKGQGTDDMYKPMMDRHRKMFNSKFGKWMMKNSFGRKIMFFFFGKKMEKKNNWPRWVAKTDEERCQNLPFLFPGNDEEWIATEKIDGTSTTFSMIRNGKFYVCSRGVAFVKKNQKCYYDTNVYIEMAEKYEMEKVIKYLLKKNKDYEFVTIQGETYGPKIQTRDYSIKEHKLAIFNVIIKYKKGGKVRLNPVEMTEYVKKINEEIGTKLECVPVLDEHFKIPETCEELLKMADGNSVLDGKIREGMVFRSKDGERSFKAVSNEYLLSKN